jgi:hypothetical protein
MRNVGNLQVVVRNTIVALEQISDCFLSTLIVATDAVQIDYYSRVIAIGDSAEFPVPALQNAVLKKVIAQSFTLRFR